MSKIPRSNYEEKPQTRPPSKNNINIQINFNMKDKPQGFAGKKIDNYVEIQQKPAIKGEVVTRVSDQVKKIKKKTNEATFKPEKDKIFETPNKNKTFQRNKIYKNNADKTPERKSNSRQRSKSTNQKMIKRKNAKSVQNLKAGVKYIRNKERSASTSQQKSRSHSKSSKKLIKSNKESLKNLFSFSNAGIKNKAGKQKTSNSRDRTNSAAGKTSEPDHEKLKKFMEEKKRKEKQDKIKTMRQQKIKKEKIMEELKKVEVERKANASKSFIALKKNTEDKQQRLPMYFEDEDEDFDEGYDRLKQQATKIIHDSPPPSNPIQTIPIHRAQPFQKHQSSSKKFSKHKKIVLVHKYLNNSITSKEMTELKNQIIKIQSLWRGYRVRKQLFRKLSDESTRIRYIKNRIDSKRGNFWNDEENSIIKIQRDSNIHIYDSGSSSYNYINFNSNGQSNNSNNSNNLSIGSGQKPKNEKFKKLSIQLDEELEQEDIEREKEKEKKEKEKDKKTPPSKEENSKILKEMEQLRKLLEEQNKKNKFLEGQIQTLKENFQILSLKQSRNVLPDKIHEQINNSSGVEFIEIRMPKKIQSPIQSNNQDSRLQFSQKSKDISQPETAEKPSVDLNSFKKQFQAFQCSSPSNARIQQHLKTLKNKNIEGLFRKKQLKIEQKYEKKFDMFDKMLNDRLFSPRTYTVKKKQLESKLKTEKDQIKVRMEEAKRVVGFIQDISESDSHSEREEQIDIRGAQLRFDEPKPNFKKQKVLKDTFTNTSPHEQKQLEFKSAYLKNKKHAKESHSNSSYSSEEDKHYKKYWTDDIQEVHKHTIQITRKIDEALKADSETSSVKKSDEASQYNSNNSQGYHSQEHEKEEVQPPKQEKPAKSDDGIDVNLQTLKESYEDYMEEIKDMPTENQKKAQQIFNRINLNDDEDECKSEQEEEQDQSHGDLCALLNTRSNHSSPNNEIKQVQNLYISQVEYNKKKRKEQELSRSSSFEKSNKSLSVNNSQLQAKGFITNLTFIKEFCISVCEFVRNNQSYKQGFVNNVSESIKYDFVEYLRSYRLTVKGEPDNNYNTFHEEYLYPYFKIITNKIQAISQDLFTDFLKSYEEQKVNSPRWNEPSMNKNIKDMRQFFLVSIIDAFNESLQYQRPGSVHGDPLPWLHNSKVLKNHQNIHLRVLAQKHKIHDQSDEEDEHTEQQAKLDQIFGASIAKIIQWGSCLCGFIADPMPMEMGDSQIANLSDEQLSSIRENRVGLMLQKWLLEEQEKITNSTAEYTQVLLGLGEKITEMLIFELSEQIAQFRTCV